MRIAVLADIHGNLLAFEAALAHAQARAVDQIIIAGDVVVGAPDSAACWRLAASLGCPIVRGNHERYLADLGTERAEPIWSTPQYAPLQHAASQLGAAERAAIAALPQRLRPPDAPELLVVHASLRSDRDSLTADTPDAALPALFPDPAAALIIRGHNHVPAARAWGERLIVTAGSVGLPLNGETTAQYLLLERRRSGWRAEHQSAPYDLDAALRRFEQGGYLEATGVIGQLYQRELATARLQLTPFLRLYGRLAAEGPIDMETALARYLA
jgi:predicted phosphodiesterase